MVVNEGRHLEKAEPISLGTEDLTLTFPLKAKR